MGEQSNALWILLHNDRKSRHRRIKKQRRYGRLAATSQFLGTEGFIQAFPPVLTSLSLGMTVISLLIITLSGGSSMYLRPVKTHTLPCVEPLSAFALPESAADHPIPWNYLPYSSKYCTAKELPLPLGVQGSKDFPASRCVASELPFLANTTCLAGNYNT